MGSLLSKPHDAIEKPRLVFWVNKKINADAQSLFIELNVPTENNSVKMRFPMVNVLASMP